MPNKLYTAPEATLTFQDSTGDYAISLNNLADGAGRVSANASKILVTPIPDEVQ